MIEILPPSFPDKFWFSTDEAAPWLDLLSRTSVHAMIERGEIKAISRGRNVRISRAELIRVMHGIEAAA